MRASDVEILALTSDEQLLQALQEAAHDAHGLQHAATASEAAHLAAEHLVGVFVTDLPLDQLAETIAPLALRAPGLVTIVVGERDHSNDLLEATSTGSVFRFLLKPVPTGQLRLYIEAAVKHHLELVARGPEIAAAPVPEPPEPMPEPRSSRGLLIAGAIGALTAIGGWVVLSTPREVEPVALSVAAPPSAGTMEVLSLLSQARRAEHEGHLVEPPGHNALDLYLRVLLEEPNKVEASRALTAIADQMFERADAALSSGQLDEARTAIAHARRALPGHPRLAYFATRLEVEEQRAMISQALQAAGTGEIGKAAGLIDEAAHVRLGESGAVVEARAELTRREEVQGRINRLLALAQTRLGEGHLIDPAEDNALFYLEAARSVGATPEAAAPVATALGSALITEGSAATHRGDFAAAKQWLAHASQSDPNAESLASAEIELAAASDRSEQLTRWYRLAMERLDHGALAEPADDSAAYYLGRLRTDAPEFVGLEAALARFTAAALDAARDALAAKQLDQARQQIDMVKTLGIRSPDLAAFEAQYTAAEKAASAANATPAYATLVRRKYVPPAYPVPAERRQIEGRVELALTVDASGKVKDIEIKSAKPRDTFEKAAVAAAQKWEYQPAEVDGKPVESRTLVAIDFSLE
jgi:TonB family protein